MKPEIWTDPCVLDVFPGGRQHPGCVFWVIDAPFSMSRNKPEIIGTTIVRGSEAWKVLGVECHALGVPIRTGERISILVERTDLPSERDEVTG